jgi:Uma2 family endonuclease
MGRTPISPVLGEAVEQRLEIVALTVKQYDWLIENGKLAEDTTTELIDGFIVKKDRSAIGENPLTVGDRHRTAVVRLAELNPKFRKLGSFIQSQQPIWIPPISEPEPDLSVIRGSIDDYLHSKPGYADICAVIEVADSSLKRDLGVKLRMYARGKIAEYIVVNLLDNVVMVHRNPSRGKYPPPKELRFSDTLRISAGNGRFVAIAVATLL